MAIARSTPRMPQAKIAQDTSSPSTSSAAADRAVVATSSGTAAVSHLSCCRSAPPERRKRSTIEATAANDPKPHTAMPNQPIAAGRPGTPSGLSTHSKPNSGPG